MAYEEELKNVQIFEFGFISHSMKINKKNKNFTQEISNNIPGMEIREEEEDEGFFKILFI